MCIKDTFLAGMKAEDMPSNVSKEKEGYQYIHYANVGVVLYVLDIILIANIDLSLPQN